MGAVNKTAVFPSVAFLGTVRFWRMHIPDYIQNGELHSECNLLHQVTGKKDGLQKNIITIGGSDCQDYSVSGRPGLAT